MKTKLATFVDRASQVLLLVIATGMLGYQDGYLNAQVDPVDPAGTVRPDLPKVVHGLITERRAWQNAPPKVVEVEKIVKVEKVVEVEKLVEVEKIVEKRVEVKVPVEVVVDKVVQVVEYVEVPVPARPAPRSGGRWPDGSEEYEGERGDDRTPERPGPEPGPEPESEGDHDRGHGNDEDGFDEDNPGRGGFEGVESHGEHAGNGGHGGGRK